jgi:protein transport protein SEC24
VPVSSEYFCGLDSDLRRLDHLQRPELCRGTVDFTVPEEYWAPQPDPRLMPSYYTPYPRSAANRHPQPMRYVFAIDVSSEAVLSGLVQSACASLVDILYGSASQIEPNDQPVIRGPCFPLASQIAIITFDRTLHFYNLSVRRASEGVVFVTQSPHFMAEEYRSSQYAYCSGY